MQKLNASVSFLSDYVKNIKPAQSEKVNHFSDFSTEALEYLRGDGSVSGDPMPWMKTQSFIRFRPAEVTIWAGTNGSGKSLVSTQVAVSLSTYTRVAIASFEMPPHTTTARIYKQCGGGDISDEYAERINQKLDLFIYNHIGTVTTQDVYNLCQYMAVEMGVKHIFIDCLIKIKMDISSYSKEADAIRDFMSTIQNIAKQYKIHIHVVHHTRKSEKETDTPDKYSVRGASDLVDLTDNLLLVWRNLKKENDIAFGEKVDDEIEPDCYIKTAKQRHAVGQEKQVFFFWFNQETTQWCERSDRRRHIYVH